MKPVNSEAAEKLRATLFSSKNEATGSKMVAEEKNHEKSTYTTVQVLDFLGGPCRSRTATY